MRIPSLNGLSGLTIFEIIGSVVCTEVCIDKLIWRDQAISRVCHGTGLVPPLLLEAPKRAVKLYVRHGNFLLPGATDFSI